MSAALAAIAEPSKPTANAIFESFFIKALHIFYGKEMNNHSPAVIKRNYWLDNVIVTLSVYSPAGISA